MAVDHTEFVRSTEDESHGTLKLTGYVRGGLLNANQLVYLQNIGQFQIEKIVSIVDKFKHMIKVSNRSIDADIPMEGNILSLPNEFQVI
jgi:hypothetical protein